MSGPGIVLLAALAATVAGARAAPTSTEPGTLRYQLEAGDRLVYRQTLLRKSERRGAVTEIRAEWTNEVLVLARGRQGAVVGVERRRRSAEPVPRRGDAASARELVERLARRPVVVAGANAFDDRGRPMLAPRVDREWPSELLPFVEEIQTLPLEAVARGRAWRGTHPLGLEFRAEAWEELGGEACLRIVGKLPRDQVVLRLWFGPESGLLRRVELAGFYPVFGGEVREQLQLELLERRRGERLDDWLHAPERREGALAALLIADGVPVEAARLEPLLGVADTGVQQAVLRLLWRRRLPAATPALAPLTTSDDPRVRALATRVLAASAAAEAPRLLEARLADADAFVRDAARRGLRRVEPAREGVASLAQTAAAVRGGGTLADWRCGADPSWAERALDEQRLPAEPPGVRMHAMASGRWRGQPYVLRVPDEYRGDEPLPLLVYLSGGPGRALVGWSSAAEALAPTGYLAAFPQASGMWWSPESEELVAQLLDELLERFNVDTNRVYLAGFSNGGTGTHLYAARWADRLAAAVSLEGAGRAIGPGVSVPPAGGFGRLPLLFVHGDRDRTIDVEHSLASAEAVRRANRDARVELRVLAGRGHDVALGTDDGLTLAFLERHRRDPFPREVTFSLDDLRSARRYWIEVLQKKGGEARVEARIADDGVVTVATKRVRRLRLLLRRELLPAAPELRVLVDGREAFRGAPVEDCALLQRSWHATRDPFRAHSIEVPLDASR